MPDVHAHEPLSVQRFPTVDYNAPSNGQFLVRFVAKLQIRAPGDYRFWTFRRAGGLWLGINGYAVVQNSETTTHAGQGCDPYEDVRELEETVYLGTGIHDFEVVYYSRKANWNATATVMYAGPDTDNALTLIDPSRFLSPMPVENTTSAPDVAEEELMPGTFRYDTSLGLAVMPAGGCDSECRLGQQRHAALTFKLFCREATTVRFTAEVAAGARKSMMWVDGNHLMVWTMRPQDAEYDAGFSSVETSSPSPGLELSAGEHTLMLQGRPTQFEAFAFRRLDMIEGSESCDLVVRGDRAHQCHME